MLGLHVQHLPADHTELARAQREHPRGLDDAGRGQRGCGKMAECSRQQGVARQNGRCLTVDLVVRQAAAAVIVIVHARQIVVDEAVGMHHLHGGSKRQGVHGAAAAQLAEGLRQHRAKALSPGKQAVAHGVKQDLLRLVRIRKAGVEIALHAVGIAAQQRFKFQHRQAPFPAGRRLRPW